MPEIAPCPTPLTFPCPACGVTATEFTADGCPTKGLSPELTIRQAIGAARIVDDSGDDGVCESCQ